MRTARIYVHGIEAGILKEQSDMTFEFTYGEHYVGPPVSLTMPIVKKTYGFNRFPPFFEGLLPEGILLDSISIAIYTT